jgi:hypothetical protein
VSIWGNPHAVRERGYDWTLDAAPDRLIMLGAGDAWYPNQLALRRPDDARALAAALLRAADLAEQPEPASAALAP